MKDNIIPIFYACDDNFVKYTIVSLHSMMVNASKDYRYQIHVLHTNISAEMQQVMMAMENENFSVSFEISGTEELNRIIEKIRQIDSVIDIERAAT